MTSCRSQPPVELLRARYPRQVLDLLRTLDGAGHRSWLVGGAVRDRLLRRPRAAADHDVATPARPEEVTALFRKVVPTGIEHGTVTVLLDGMALEVTTFRGEGPYVDGRRPSSVRFLDQIDDDLARRDFTVNAMAYDPLGKVLRDPFDGRADLGRRVLRAVGRAEDRFSEDGLRPFRAVRLAAELGFRLAPATAKAIPTALPVAARVSVERVCDELSRIVLAARALHGLRLLDATGLLAVAIPSLAVLPPGSRRHAFRTVGVAAPDLTIRMAALMHVLASDGRNAAAATVARASLERLRFPGSVSRGVASLVERGGCLLAGSRILPDGEVETRRWLSGVERSRAPALLALWEAEAEALEGSPRRIQAERARLRALRARLRAVERSRPPLTTAELALDGRSVMEILGARPGPVVGEALAYLLGRVLEDPSLNTKARLASQLRNWWASRRP